MSFDYDSAEWEEERSNFLAWHGYVCDRCGTYDESLHVHHAEGTYSNVYEGLCPDCHAVHHGKPELAYMRKNKPRCNKCSLECNWTEYEGRWRLEEKNGELHDCVEKIPPKPELSPDKKDFKLSNYFNTYGD